jgi:hypothetical protein
MVEMKIYIQIVILSILVIPGFSQTDSIYTVVKDTVIVIDKHDQQYKYFVENRETETKHLWKINLVDIALLMPNFGYEQRLSKSWTVEGYFRYGSKAKMTLIPYDKHPLPDENHSYSSVLELEQQFKYFFNLKRREDQGKKTNGFSGDFLSSSLWFKQFDDPEITNDTSNALQINHINLGIKYGLQRRIGALGYFELSLGFYYRWEIIEWKRTKNQMIRPEYWNEYNKYFFPVINLKAGFAIDSFDIFRRMIKD